MTTSIISAATEAQLQQVFLAVTARAYNDMNFYPFIYTFNGTCIAHGWNSANLGRRLQDIVNASTQLRGLQDGTVLHETFAQSAAEGGGWAGYWWRNSEGEDPYLKIALVSGVSHFGEHYYLGVGFTHVQSPCADGPHCATCKQNYNYPCAWANAKGLIGHAHSLLFMSNRHTATEAFALLSENKSYGGGGSLWGRDANSTADWLYPFVYDFNGTCVAHGANKAYVGRKLWDIINGSAALSRVVNGRDLHEKFVAAASGEGRWVSYDWWSGTDAAVYQKLSYSAPHTAFEPRFCACTCAHTHIIVARHTVVRVTREGRMYYLGVGLADYDWHVHGQKLSGEGGGTSRWLWGCSVENQHPCSEDWAMTVAGRRMSTVLKAASYAELQASFSKPTQSKITFGFETHVHNGTSVLWDGHDASFIGKPIGEWLSAVGLSQADLLPHHSAGSWLGPFDMRLTRGGEPASRYLFLLSLPVEDELADGLKDGVGDVYNVLVAVSGTDPMKVAAPSSETGGANECLQRPSAPLPKTSGGDLDDHSERIKCVTLTAEIASASEYCSNEVNAYGVCPGFPNTWSDGAYTLDLACVDRAANEGRWENDTFCSCAANYNLRFAAERKAQCSAPKDECALEDSSCANHLILQTEYSQYCSLKPSDPSESWYPWTNLYVAVIVSVSSLVLFVALPLAIVLFNRYTKAEGEVRSTLLQTRLFDLVVWLGVFMHSVATPLAFVHSSNMTDGTCTARTVLTFLATAMVFLGVALRMGFGGGAMAGVESEKALLEKKVLAMAEMVLFFIALVLYGIMASSSNSRAAVGNLNRTVGADTDDQSQLDVRICRDVKNFSPESLTLLYLPLLVMGVLCFGLVRLCVVDSTWCGSLRPTLVAIILNLIAAFLLLLLPEAFVTEFPTRATRATLGFVVGSVTLCTEFVLPMYRQWEQQKKCRQESHLYEKANGVDQLFRMDVKDRAPFRTEEKGDGWHLFLSHRWKTAQDQVHSLHANLRVMVPTLRIWLDTEEANSNTTAIVDAVKDCDVFLLFLTPEYLKSFFCQKELFTAWTNNIPIIIMRDKEFAEDEFALSIKYFSNKQANGGKWSAEEIVKLLEAIEHVRFINHAFAHRP